MTFAGLHLIAARVRELRHAAFMYDTCKRSNLAGFQAHAEGWEEHLHRLLTEPIVETIDTLADSPPPPRYMFVRAPDRLFDLEVVS